MKTETVIVAETVHAILNTGNWSQAGSASPEHDCCSDMAHFYLATSAAPRPCCSPSRRPPPAKPHSSFHYKAKHGFGDWPEECSPGAHSTKRQQSHSVQWWTSGRPAHRERSKEAGMRSPICCFVAGRLRPTNNSCRIQSQGSSRPWHRSSSWLCYLRSNPTDLCHSCSQAVVP